MAVIFFFSSLSKSEVPSFNQWDLLVKKSAHFVGYALLGGALLRGLARPHSAGTGWRLWAGAVLLAALYAVSDEFHQSFVAGRGARATDVLIDSLGAALGAWIWLKQP